MGAIAGTEGTLCEGQDFLPWDELQAKLSDLGLALDANNVPLIRTLLKDLVPGYQHDGDVVDSVRMETTCEQINYVPMLSDCLFTNPAC